MIKKKIILVTLLTAIFAIALTSTVSAVTWSKTTIDTEINTGSYNSLVTDSQGNPHLSYSRDGQVVKYATKNGNKWTIETVGTIGTSGGNNQLAIDSANIPHMIYHYSNNNFETNQILNYAKKVNGKWVTQKSFATGRNTGCALALDKNKNPHLVYGAFFNNFNFDMYYSTLSGGKWTTEKLGVNRPWSPKIAVDNNGIVHIAYNDLDGYLAYATKVNGKWTFTKVEKTGNYVQASLKLDSAGTPNISYFNSNTGYLRYAKKVNGQWSLTNVVKTGNNPFPALAFDKIGAPNIIYHQGETLQYARKNGSIWNVENVDNCLGIGFNSIAVDKSGNLHTSYWGSNQSIRYAYKDITSPRIYATLPTNLKTGYSLTASIIIKFTENIQQSINWNYIKIKNLTTNSYVFLTKTITSNTLTLKTGTRTKYTWYQVIIPTAAVRDLAGNNLLATYTFKFRTGA